MTGQAKGRAFGAGLTRAMSEPWDGKILTDKVESTAQNEYMNLSMGQNIWIKGVAVKANPDNTAAVYIIELNKDGNPGIGDQGYPLDPGDAISLATDNLSKVNVFIPTLGDKVHYCAIAAANSVEP